MPTATAVPEAEAVALTVAYTAEMARLGDMVGAAIREVFESMPALDRAELAEFIAATKPLAHAGATEAADLASAYLAELSGTMPAAVDLAIDLPALDGPFLHHWHNLTERMPWDESRVTGAGQAEMLGPDAVKRGANARMGKPGMKTRGFRRCLHPGACEWCQVVSTQLYKSAESASFGHHACRCYVIPVIGGADAVAAINRKRLGELRRSGAVQRVSKARDRSRARQRSG